MKKNAKRLLGLLIVLAMMVSLVGTMALADSTAAAKEPVVTYIGTSVSSGFFLPQDKDEWNEGDWAKIVADGAKDFGKDEGGIALARQIIRIIVPSIGPVGEVADVGRGQQHCVCVYKKLHTALDFDGA